MTTQHLHRARMVCRLGWVRVCTEQVMFPQVPQSIPYLRRGLLIWVRCCAGRIGSL